MKEVDQVFAFSYQEYCGKIAQRALSPLISISDEAFHSGLEKLRQWVSSQPSGVAVHEPVDLFLFQSGKQAGRADRKG
jgi:hypothetical protein